MFTSRKHAIKCSGREKIVSRLQEVTLYHQGLAYTVRHGTALQIVGGPAQQMHTQRFQAMQLRLGAVDLPSFTHPYCASLVGS